MVATEEVGSAGGLGSDLRSAVSLKQWLMGSALV